MKMIGRNNRVVKKWGDFSPMPAYPRHQDTGVAYPLFNSLIYEEPMFEFAEAEIFLPVATSFVNHDDVVRAANKNLEKQ